MDQTVIGTSSNVKDIDNVTYQFSWTTPDDSTEPPFGYFYIDASVDGKTWIPMDLQATVAAQGQSGTAMIEINQTGAIFLRPRYQPTSGGGDSVLTVSISGKSI
jgi:hypothetical protein